jgi:hypothetical protein
LSPRLGLLRLPHGSSDPAIHQNQQLGHHQTALGASMYRPPRIALACAEPKTTSATPRNQHSARRRSDFRSDRPAAARRYLGVRPRWHRMDNSARPGVGCPLKAVFGHPTEYETRAGVDRPLKAVFGLNLGCRMTWRATRPRPSVSSMCRLAHCRIDR